ncbi:NAD(P)H-binding protein [Niallia sp. NCCP-28]|uniref:NAD(P)H-binding protein n=1 Tax=Niallia sp. NCCP-28 TaxID=2934712 RepID=UPI0020842C1F|nr:NAD(P)H-binding protein [Niallia sp. NCCP-28]GKU83759.1 oxidoreductase [Niallia sp. NCCP-28]
MVKKALIIGATGLVGEHLLQILLQSNTYKEIIAFVRKPLGYKHEKLKEVIIDFDQLDQYQQYFAVDDIYCCLGTTIKKAKTQQNMMNIDVDYPVKCAELGKQMGVKQFIVISAIGANSKSSIFYSRIKGILEENLAAFSFEALLILQPSLLIGEREEFRFGEKLSSFILPLFHQLMVGPLKKYKGIHAEKVAATMYKIAQMDQKGVVVLSSDKIEILAEL